MNYWDGFFKDKGFVYDPQRMPTNYVTTMETGSDGGNILLPEAELEELIQNDNFRQLARFYGKGDVGLYLRFNFADDEPIVEMTLDNSASVALLEEDFAEKIPTMLRFYEKFKTIRERGANVENKKWTPGDAAYPTVFFVNTSSARIDRLFQDVLPNRKFFFQTRKFYNTIAVGEQGTLTPNDFRWLKTHLLHTNHLAIYNRTSMVQPQATGESSEYSSASAGDVRTEFYKEGYEKGQLYLLDTKTAQVVAKTSVKLTSVYDFQEAPYEADKRMKEYCKTLTADLLDKDASDIWWYAFEDYFQSI